uniref:Alpha-tectorin-like n=1 Tax=Stegastes partitus TaxID=144197 RepID=A0A3B5ACG6_9TELE
LTFEFESLPFVLMWRHYLFSPGPLYPIGGTTSARSDDGSSPRIALSRPFVYFGQSHNQIYVNHNGDLTFNAPWSRYTPERIPMHGTRDIIAPFWTDIDNRRNGQINYMQYTSGTVLQQATRDINTYFPRLSFTAEWVFVATWYQVAYYPFSRTQSTFQAVLISGGQYSFVLMNYGTIAPPTRRVEVGYDTVNSVHHFSITGTYLPHVSSILSVDISALTLSNVNVPRRFAFRVDHGSRGCTFNGKTRTRGWSPQCSFRVTSKCHQALSENVAKPGDKSVLVVEPLNNVRTADEQTNNAKGKKSSLEVSEATNSRCRDTCREDKTQITGKRNHKFTDMQWWHIVAWGQNETGAQCITGRPPAV